MIKGCGEPAVDFIMQKLGLINDVEIELIIPICDKCVGLIDTGMWILLYCLKCETPHWGYKPMLMTEYENNSFACIEGCVNCLED